MEPIKTTMSEIELATGFCKTYTPLSNMGMEVLLTTPATVSSRTSQGTRSIGESQTEETGEELLERIKSTPDGLEKSLALNQALQNRISSNIRKMEETLKKNLQRQLFLHNELDEEKFSHEEEKDLRDSDSKYFLRISTFCKPYFKTKNAMPAPMNEDAKYKRDHCYLDMYQTQYRQWSLAEKRKLQDDVCEEARSTQISQWRSIEADLFRERRTLIPNTDQYVEKFRNISDRTQQVSDEIAKLQMMPVRSVPVPFDVYLDWIKIAAQTSNGHRSPEECQYMWENLLSTNLCQAEFSEKDDVIIQSAVRSYGKTKCDWEAISATLTTNRSPFQVFRRYVSFIAPTLTPNEWNESNTQEFIEIVEANKIGDYIPWSQVHQLMPGFSRIQLQARWRKVNPNRKKGPFTTEEDVLFLKALHKFGANFSHVCKFLPKRNIDQVKDRFKRILVNVFSTTWTQDMDNELHHLCNQSDNQKLSSTLWKRLATVEGFAKTGKDANMLKFRYLILKLWAELSLGTESPPQLFPLSITTSSEDINQLLVCFKNADSTDIRELVDRINGGNHIKSALDELEKKRKRLHDQNDMRRTPNFKTDNISSNPRSFTLNHLHIHQLHSHNTKILKGEAATGLQRTTLPALDLRKVPVGRTISLSWPEQTVQDFFLPGVTGKKRIVNFETDTCAIESITELMNALQVRPLPVVQPQEVEYLKRLNIHTQEMNLVNSLIGKHTCTVTGKGSVPCLWCLSFPSPESIPLLPPSSSTITALQSLLLHKNTLEDMARGKFVFHRLSSQEVRALGDKQKPLIIDIKTEPKMDDYEAGNLPRPGLIGKIHITSVNTKARSLKAKKKKKLSLKKVPKSCRGGPRIGLVKRKKAKWSKKSIIDIYNSYKSGKIFSKYIGNKKSSNCENSNSADNEVKTYDNIKKNVVEKTELTVIDREADEKDSINQCTITQNMKLEMATTSQEDSLHSAQEDSAEEGTRDEQMTEEFDMSLMTAEELSSMEDTENLLWHRFLAVFLWPAIMTMGKPTDKQQDIIQNQVCSQKFETNRPYEDPQSDQFSEDNSDVAQDRSKPGTSNTSDSTPTNFSVVGAAEQILQDVKKSTARKRTPRAPCGVLVKKRKVVLPAVRVSTRKRIPVIKTEF